MPSFAAFGNDLYTGKRSYDIVGHRRWWYSIATVLVLASVVLLLTKGFNAGIEFRGGSQFQISSVQDRDQSLGVRAVTSTAPGAQSPLVSTVGSDSVRVQTEKLTQAETDAVSTALAKAYDVPESSVTSSFVGPSWGKDISDKAIRGLVIFLVLAAIVLSLYFRTWKMSAAALIALVHDVVLTAGIYSLTGFEVTPATVIGFLTILGYSLYDTVVVFDKVRENTAHVLSSSNRTLAEAANLAVNQTLVRSINTSVVALLPVASILFIGAFVLGAGTLRDISLALFVGIIAGAYSSIFIATPLFVQLMERQDDVRRHSDKVLTRRSGGGAPTGRTGSRAAVAAGAPSGSAPAGATTAVLDRPASQDGTSDGFDGETGGGQVDGGASGASPGAAPDPRSPQPAGPPSGRSPAVTPPDGPRAGSTADQVRQLLRPVPDFPNPGITFWDITPVLGDAAALAASVDALAGTVPRPDGAPPAAGGHGIDLVAGVEARGFLLGTPVALALGAGFVPVRKVGKLPSRTVVEHYDLEYGQAAIEVHEDAVRPGQRVLLVDDVLATGGTARAACRLLERLGAQVVAVRFLVELGGLGGAATLAGRDVASVVTL